MAIDIVDKSRIWEILKLYLMGKLKAANGNQLNKQKTKNFKCLLGTLKSIEWTECCAP